MGNSFGVKRRAKVMKLDGEIIKFKLPVNVQDVVKDYPDHVLMDSEAVRHLGVRARPMEEYRELKPKRLYFLVQLPKVVVEDKAPRRVRSGVINMGAKERLESLMLSRRSTSDLTLLKSSAGGGETGEGGGVRVRLRLPKAQVARMVEESQDAGEAAEKIMELYAGGKADVRSSVRGVVRRDSGVGSVGGGLRSIEEGRKPPQKLGVRFLPVQEDQD